MTIMQQRQSLHYSELMGYIPRHLANRFTENTLLNAKNVITPYYYAVSSAPTFHITPCQKCY